MKKTITIIAIFFSVITFAQTEDCNKFMFEKTVTIFFAINEDFINCNDFNDALFDYTQEIDENNFEYIISKNKKRLSVYRYKNGKKVFLINKKLQNNCFMGCYTWYMTKTWVEFENINELIVYSISLQSGHEEEDPPNFYQKTTYKFISEFEVTSNTEVYSEENNSVNPFNEKGIYDESIYSSKKYIDIIENKYHATYNKTYAFRLEVMERFFKEFYTN